MAVDWETSPLLGLLVELDLSIVNWIWNARKMRKDSKDEFIKQVIGLGSDSSLKALRGIVWRNNRRNNRRLTLLISKVVSATTLPTTHA